MARAIAGNALDGRTWIAKALKDIRDDLATDRGCFQLTDDAEAMDKCHAGTCGHLSAAERILIARAAALSVIVQSIEHWVFSQAGVVTPAGELLSVLRRGYATHTANLGRILVVLGLGRAKQVPDLAMYLRSRSNGTPAAPAAPVVAATAPATPADGANKPAPSEDANDVVSPDA